MSWKDPANVKKAATFLVAAYVVLATYTIWAFNAWHGHHTSVIVLTMAILITIAGASVIFGSDRMSKAMNLMGEARGFAQEVKKLREERENEEN